MSRLLQFAPLLRHARMQRPPPARMPMIVAQFLNDVETIAIEDHAGLSRLVAHAHSLAVHARSKRRRRHR